MSGCTKKERRRRWPPTGLWSASSGSARGMTPGSAPASAAGRMRRACSRWAAARADLNCGRRVKLRTAQLSCPVSQQMYPSVAKELPASYILGTRDHQKCHLCQKHHGQGARQQG